MKQPVKTSLQPELHTLNNMKKTFLLTLLISLILMSGCSKVQLDSEGCFTDADAALKYASKKDRNLLLCITMENDDAESTAFLNSVLRNENFKNEIASDYVLLHFDFSQRLSMLDFLLLLNILFVVNCCEFHQSNYLFHHYYQGKSPNLNYHN